MKQNIKSIYVILGNLIILGIWIAIILLRYDWDIRIYPNFIAGICFGAGTLAFSIFYFLAIRSTASPEVAAVPGGIIILFSIITAVLNYFFVFTREDKLNKTFIIMNIILIGIYAFLLIMAAHNAASIHERTQTAQQKISPVSHISGNVGNLLSLTQNPQIRKALLDLKQAVDYSPNLTSPAAAQYEQAFVGQLGDIRNLLYQNADSMDVLAAIRQASDTWKARNSIQAEYR